MLRRGARGRPAKGQHIKRPKAPRKASPTRSSTERPQREEAIELRAASADILKITGSSRSDLKPRKPGSVKGRNTGKTKRRIVPTAIRPKRSSSLGKELKERREQQAAAADILRVIASSPSDVQPVFEAIAESAARLCQAEFCNVFRFDGELIHFMHSYGYSREAIEALRHFYPMRPGRGSCAGRAILNGKVEQVPDVRADPEYVQGNVPDIMKISSIVAVPMVKEGRPVGAIALVRAAKGTFPQRQVDLLKTFADQAVIAIENARLFEELRERTGDLEESLKYQTATSDVLKVISRSTFDLQPILDTLVETAARPCQSDTGLIAGRDGDIYRGLATFAYAPEYAAFWRDLRLEPTRATITGRVAIERRVIHIVDTAADPEFFFPSRSRSAKTAPYSACRCCARVSRLG
jgi:two-component system, NtrC family, sensor kinase